MAKATDECWVVEITKDKFESMSLYYHVLKLILNESALSSVHIVFTYILRPSSFWRRQACPLDHPSIQGKIRLIQSEVLLPVVRNMESWWRNLSGNPVIENSSMTVENVTAGWHVQAQYQREDGLASAVEFLGAARLYMFGKRTLFTGKFDKASEICMGRLPHCGLIIFQNGNVICNLAPSISHPLPQTSQSDNSQPIIDGSSWVESAHSIQTAENELGLVGSLNPHFQTHQNNGEKTQTQAVMEHDILVSPPLEHVVHFHEFTTEEIYKICHGFNESLIVGEGRLSIVYRGSYSLISVAVKIAKNPELECLFQREGNVYSSLRHPNIVAMIGWCRNPACCVYEFMEGGSLEDRLLCRNGTKPLTWVQRFEIFENVCLGVLYLHDRNPPVVLIDMRPEKVLLDGNLTAKLADVSRSRPVGRITQFSFDKDFHSLGLLLWDLVSGVSTESAQGAIKKFEAYLEGDNLEGVLGMVDGAADWPPYVVQRLCLLVSNCCSVERVGRSKLRDGVLKVIQELRLFVASYNTSKEEEMKSALKK